VVRRASFRNESIEDGFLHDPTVAEVLDDDALEELGSDASVPHTVGIDDNDRTAGAYSQARRLAALHTTWAKQQSLTLEKRGKARIQLATAAIR
jgi:hypothetical protein